MKVATTDPSTNDKKGHTILVRNNNPGKRTHIRMFGAERLRRGQPRSRISEVLMALLLVHRPPHRE